jgi:hypothetical protein
MVNLKYLFCVTLTEEDKYSPFGEKDGLRISKEKRVKFIRLRFADILAWVTHDELNKYFSIL